MPVTELITRRVMFDLATSLLIDYAARSEGVTPERWIANAAIQAAAKSDP